MYVKRERTKKARPLGNLNEGYLQQLFGRWSAAVAAVLVTITDIEQGVTKRQLLLLLKIVSRLLATISCRRQQQQGVLVVAGSGSAGVGGAAG